MSPYDPKKYEGEIYKKWENSGYFNPDKCVADGITSPDAEPFCIVLPPPNVTGVLHTGHAMVVAVEDLLIRYNRMKGKRTLWIPGTDHAAIATQAKVEKILYKEEKKTKEDLGREKFLELVKKFAKDNYNTIVSQIRRSAASLDWSREAYTLDEKREKAVYTAFKRMYDAGIIYRGNRIVNWDPKLKTSVSNDEIEYKQEVSPFYYLKYGPFVIGTSRPETKFGDKYVVVHPDDKRYTEYKHGQKISVDWINGKVEATVIKDESIDMELGTGAMTITPWHDETDYEIAERHNLDKEQIIDFRGVLLPIAGEFEGMHIKKARDKIVEKFKSLGLLEKIDEKYEHNIATNSRGGGIIEPQIKEQWFLGLEREFVLEKSNIKGVKSGDKTTLKKILLCAVENGQIEILPERYSKVYFNWINNIKDWCISRQIWFGHRIPVWYKGDDIHCDAVAPKGDGWEQDSDTLDTWFSSGLWTFSTLGWPDTKEKDFQVYHPTSTLTTGYDILIFWIVRMILMSGFCVGDIPFKTVYLNGLVRDEKGRKMSKSLGNAINPIDVIEKYGNDALRFSILVSSTPGNDLNFSDDRVKSAKHFANKIWNITRFILSNMPSNYDFEKDVEFTDKDLVLHKELQVHIKHVTDNIDSYSFHLAAEKLYAYVWHNLADVIIEESKEVLNGQDEAAKQSRARVLYEILTTNLKMLHPFMPSITEEIWSSLPHKNMDLLMVEKWPKLS